MKKRENNFFLNLGQFVSNLIVLERSQRASEKIKTDQHEDEGWKTVTHVRILSATRYDFEYTDSIYTVLILMWVSF